jgi:hypothetical protein
VLEYWDNRFSLKNIALAKFILALERLCRNATKSPYLSSRAEREILHFQLHAKKRFLASGSK